MDTFVLLRLVLDSDCTHHCGHTQVCGPTAIITLQSSATLSRNSQLQKEQPLHILEGSNNRNCIILCDFPEAI